MKVNEKFEALNGKETDPRTRRYLAPRRVVLTEGDVRDPETLLRERSNQITLVTGENCTLRNQPGKPHAKILLDFGIEFAGSVRLMIWGTQGPNNRADINVRFGESVMEALTPIREKNTTNDHAIRDRVMNVGMLSACETNESGFRFVCIELLEEEGMVQFKAVQGVFHYLDLDYVGSFSCSDEKLNRIWDTAAYTAHLNMQEFLWDGIKRDRLVWIGDMHTEVNTILTAFGYNDIVPRSLDVVRDETPIGSWMNGISSYSIWWLLIHCDWYRAFGDRDYLEQQHTYLRELMTVLAGCVDADGAEHMPERRFLDWPNNDDPAAIHAGLQGMLRLALTKGAELLRVLGEDETAALCEAAAARMLQHVPDCHGSKQAAALLSLSGLADPKAINADVLTPGGGHGYSTFFGYYILAAKALAGDYAGALADMKQYWGGMLDMGATTFWEDFNLDWMNNAGRIDEVVPEGKIDIHGDYGAYCYIRFRHSLCHGWASLPLPVQLCAGYPQPCARQVRGQARACRPGVGKGHLSHPEGRAVRLGFPQRKGRNGRRDRRACRHRDRAVREPCAPGNLLQEVPRFPRLFPVLFLSGADTGSGLFRHGAFPTPPKIFMRFMQKKPTASAAVCVRLRLADFLGLSAPPAICPGRAVPTTG